MRKTIKVTQALIAECFLGELIRRIGLDGQAVLNFSQTPTGLRQVINDLLATQSHIAATRTAGCRGVKIMPFDLRGERYQAIFESLGDRGYSVRIARARID